MITKNTQQLAQEVKKHIDADSVTQGYYWEDGKGCFIGCLAHGNDVQQLSVTYGLPSALARICEAIFEGLSPEDAKQFFADFPDAIGYDGKNLSLVRWQFLEDVLRNLPPQKPEIQSVIDPVIAGIGLLAKGEKWNPEDAAADVPVRAVVVGVAYQAHAVARAAYANAPNDTEAADAYAEAADAYEAASGAYAVARATADAADAYEAAFAAYDVAMSVAGRSWSWLDGAENKRQRDVLLKLIRQAV
jgi:hypothetical protein